MYKMITLVTAVCKWIKLVKGFNCIWLEHVANTVPILLQSSAKSHHLGSPIHMPCVEQRLAQRRPLGPENLGRLGPAFEAPKNYETTAASWLEEIMAGASIPPKKCQFRQSPKVGWKIILKTLQITNQGKMSNVSNDWFTYDMIYHIPSSTVSWVDPSTAWGELAVNCLWR